MNASSPRFVLSASALTLALSMSSLSCTKKGPEAKDAPGSEDAALPTSEADVKPTAAASAIIPVVEPLAAAPGNVLGHLLLPDATRMLARMQKQAAPPSVAPFFSVDTLKGMAGGQLGEQAVIVQKLAFDQPIGCAALGIEDAEFAFACMFSYAGGAQALIKDLGDQVSASDVEGHLGRFQIEGEDLFLDPLGDRVVVSNHQDAYGQSKAYLESELIPRAAKLAVDFELAGFPPAIQERYGKVIEGALDTPSPFGDTGDDSVMAAWAKYNEASTRASMDTFKDMTQFSLTMGFFEHGFRYDLEMWLKEGSKYEQQMASLSDPLQLDIVGKLPKAAWFVAGANMNANAPEFDTQKQIRDVVVELYAQWAGLEAAAVRKTVEEIFAENKTLYGTSSAAGVAHLPNTSGGVIIEMPLRPGQSGRARWARWSESFKPETTLSKEAQAYVTWTMTPEAATVDGVTVDRMNIRATDELAKLWQDHEDDPDIIHLQRITSNFSMGLDRVELDGRALLVLSFGDPTPYTEAAIAAVRGRDALGDTPGYQALAARLKGRPFASAAAVDAKAAAGWVRALVPPEKSERIPALGSDLTDVYFFTTYDKAKHRSSTEFVMSQNFIDSLRALAGQ